MAAPKKPDSHDTVAHWRREAERYRPTGDAILALGSRAALDYLAIVGACRYVAENGVSRRSYDSLSRPDEVGRSRSHYSDAEGMQATSINLGGESMPPKHDPRVLAKLRAEEAWMRRRTQALTSWLDDHVGESSGEYMPRGEAAA